MDIVEKPSIDTDKRSTNVRSFWGDWSLWALVGADVWTAASAIVKKWEVADILWTFWLQSVVIGIYAFFKLLTYKNFSDKTFDINGQPHKLRLYDRIQLAGWFIFIYGFFHVVFFILLRGLNNQASSAKISILWLVVLAAGVCSVSQLFSFSSNQKRTNSLKVETSDILVFPILRIITLFLTLLIGLPLALAISGNLHSYPSPHSFGIRFDMPYKSLAHSSTVIIVFMLLKTYGDATMHIIEAKKFGNRPQPQADI